MSKKVRTRFAPSPTGRMHVGNLRTALYAYLIAKHEGGDFLLRVEDTDQERFVEGALDIIYRTMEKTGLIHDEGPDKDAGYGPYVQSERNASGLYLKYAKQLVEQGDAYYCFCDKERLESLKTQVSEGGVEISVYDKHCLSLSKEEVEANLAAGKPWVIRLNVPNEGETTFHDEIYGDITVPNAELDDMILIKSDGFPTYNFANVIDDHLMEISHVVRGNEYLSSAPKYNRLYEAFGWEVPVYVHCPLITDENHKKLSKRCGHSSYEDLIEQGYVSEAVVNYVALLGWCPTDNREIFSLEELVEAFDYHHMSKSPANSSRKLACVPVVPLDPSSFRLPSTYSRSSRSISNSCIQRVALFPTVVGCAGWKCVKASVGWFFCSSANFASSAITFTSFVRTSFSASAIIIISVLSPT